MTCIVYVAVSNDQKGEAWAADVLGELLGRPRLDVRLLKMADESMAAGSTQRLMWNLGGQRRLLVGNFDIDDWSQWFAKFQMTTQFIASEKLAATSAWTEHLVGVVTHRGEMESTIGEVVRLSNLTATADRRRVDDAELDQWIESLDQDPNL